MKNLLIFVTLLLPTLGYTHDGGLDKHGCHHNRKEASYHCHKGQNKGEVYSSKSEMVNSGSINSTEANGQHSSQVKLDKGATYQGKVVGITDGDTLTILLNKTPYKIRLAQIDTPEKRQPYGNKSKQILSDLVFNQYVKAKIETVDRYGRYVADIYLDRKHINAELIKLGAAWVYRKYVKDLKLFDLEEEARKNKRGLWSLPDADIMEPWEWRKVN